MADSNPTWSIEARLGTFPLGDGSAVGSQLLHAVLGAYLRDINVARAINCDPIGRFKLSYAGKESAGRREFFDAPIAGVGAQTISIAINSHCSRRIKLPPANAVSALKHGRSTGARNT